MENKDTHIDDFLSQKFEGFEPLPDASVWQHIEGYIEHFKHPVDLSLHSRLSDLSATPTPDQEAILKLALTDGVHPIDIALNDQLSMLEVLPDPEVYNKAIDFHGKEKRKKRGFILWLSFGLVAALIAVLATQLQMDDKALVDSPVKGENKDAAQESSQTQNNSSQQKQSTPENNASSPPVQEKTPDVLNTTPESMGKELSSKKIINENKNSNPFQIGESGKAKSDPSKPFEEKTNENVLTPTEDILISNTDLSEKRIGWVPLRKRIFFYDMESLSKIVNKPKTAHLRTLRLSPFSFHLQFGYLNENAVSQRQKGFNVHKDALPNFKKANGKSRNGDIFTVNFGYRLSGRFVVKTGFQYSSATEKSTIDYVDNQIPVKNQDGIIVDYFTSPNSSPEVHETVKNTSSSYAIPVQLYARIFENRQVSAWLGLGSDFVFNRNSKGALYSFKDEGMRTFQLVKEKKVSPLMSLMLQYHMTPSVAVTGNFQMSYLREVVHFDNAIFVKSQLLPSLRLGILYTPIIKLK